MIHTAGVIDDGVLGSQDATRLARVLAPKLAALHLHDGGHVELITNAAQLAPVIEQFRNPTLSR